LLDYKLAFDRANRFNNKIFVNKQGPIFDYKKEVLISKKSKKTPKKNIDKSMGKTTSNLIEEEMHKRKIKEMNIQENVGYSFGLKTSLNPFLKNTRRQEIQKIKGQLNGNQLFDIENITMRTKFPNINNNFNTNKSNNNTLTDNDSENSIREILQEKKQNINLIKKMKRENKLLKVKNNQDRISKETNGKNELFYSKIEKEAMDDSRYIHTNRFLVTIGNLNSDKEDNCNNNYLNNININIIIINILLLYDINLL
jgi:hypothetical protein